MRAFATDWTLSLSQEARMSDLLSAASLLLALITVLYGLWYPEITSALTQKIPPYKEDRPRPYQLVASVLFSRALPLSFAALTLGLVFLPDAVKIIWRTVVTFFDSSGTRYEYGAVETAFCVVVIFAFSVAGHAIALAFKLNQLRKRLR
jgi:hypothetical protein